MLCVSGRELTGIYGNTYSSKRFDGNYDDCCKELDKRFEQISDNL